MSAIRSITVFCSSSRDVAPVYLIAARELGAGIAEHGWQLVFGGNDVGCMAALAEGARVAGGHVVGVTPQLLVDKGIADRKCHELIITGDMRERKALMEQRGDAFVALPGGVGTLEELFEILVGRYLGFHNKPLVLLNIAGYYDPLLQMLQHGIEQHFIKPRIHDFLFVTDQVTAALRHLQQLSTGRGET
jgi:hypothetical protein